MYLEKLEIQGFKSFANKNKLVFSGLVDGQKRGLTAIVGPNGSGKSNVADSVRWALGEQSIKTLRGKKSEDVIFSGSDKKNQLGLAEVSLFLNNTETAKNKAGQPETIEQEGDLDRLILSCPEIVITRRLYRSGESEYLLNNSRVRLADIQMFLAKASFGQKTYSVIGQGLVENFLNTSAAERKDFFDEATGVKQFQIKRDSALNKLENSYENLQQVDMLLSEIKPRLKSLTRQVEKLNKRSQIEKELKANQLDYYHKIWGEANDKLDSYNTRYLEREKIKLEREKKFSKLSEELDRIKITDHNREINSLQLRLRELYDAKNQELKQLTKIQAELEMNFESQGQFDLSWLSAKEAELNAETEKIENELATLAKNQDWKEEKELTARLNRLNRELETAGAELKKASANLTEKTASGRKREQTREEINKIIIDFLARLEEIDVLEDLETIKKLLQEAQQEFKHKIKDFLETGDSAKLQEIQGIKEIQEKIINLNEDKQAVSAALSEGRYKLSALNERFKLLTEKKERTKQDLAEIKNKISKQTAPRAAAKISGEKEEINQKTDKINEQIKELERQLEGLEAAKDQEKSLIFDYQKNLQALQGEINSLNNELSDWKINAAREETRLEDLEANIRNSGLELAEIKNHQLAETEIDLERANRKIAEFKNQLEQIGGIDPETEKEYRETKERYDFLSRQTDDLNKAIKSLEEIIYELDLNIKNRFDQEFKVISEKFNDYFKILFNGGTAKISKLMIEDLEKEEAKNNPAGTGGTAEININNGLTPGEKEIKNEVDEKLKTIKFLRKHNAVGLAGIEIQATPPGKKIQTVTMLSGGERALTAIALISAIISANPSPFVILDEVDAALDEANSERLAKILDDLSDKTQFIVITHNRASMRRASILYGVTMESDGVSKLLSVKLDDLKK
ncbi:MAG: AAA family ATPase [Patescibacteria group bacterium]|jgi:chromosome segregation protein